MKKLIAGNWKMNGTRKGAGELMGEICAGIRQNEALYSETDFLVCPPFLHISAVRHVIAGAHAKVAHGGQDCALTEDGAYTSDISAAMLADYGCAYVILGHSERREYHKETSADVSQKAALAHKNGLITIICVGEKDGERQMGAEKDVVGKQLDSSIPESATAENTVIAYEPVWAIGTGKVATEEDIYIMHQFIREKLQEKLADFSNVRILYGGSVKPDSAGMIFRIDNVNGALIGGASLKADQFLGIASAV